MTFFHHYQLFLQGSVTKLIYNSHTVNLLGI